MSKKCWSRVGRKQERESNRSNEERQRRRKGEGGRGRARRVGTIGMRNEQKVLVAGGEEERVSNRSRGEHKKIFSVARWSELSVSTCERRSDAPPCQTAITRLKETQGMSFGMRAKKTGRRRRSS